MNASQREQPLCPLDPTARAAQLLTADPSFWDAIRPSWIADQGAPASPPSVPWSVVRLHAIPKLAIAGLDPSGIQWEHPSAALSQGSDPGPLLAHHQYPFHDHEEEGASDAPRN